MRSGKQKPKERTNIFIPSESDSAQSPGLRIMKYMCCGFQALLVIIRMQGPILLQLDTKILKPIPRELLRSFSPIRALHTHYLTYDVYIKFEAGIIFS